jgi:hypothetical protein
MLYKNKKKVNMYRKLLRFFYVAYGLVRRFLHIMYGLATIAVICFLGWTISKIEPLIDFCKPKIVLFKNFFKSEVKPTIDLFTLKFESFMGFLESKIKPLIDWLNDWFTRK